VSDGSVCSVRVSRGGGGGVTIQASQNVLLFLLSLLSAVTLFQSSTRMTTGTSTHKDSANLAISSDPRMRPSSTSALRRAASLDGRQLSEHCSNDARLIPFLGTLLDGSGYFVMFPSRWPFLNLHGCAWLCGLFGHRLPLLHMR
jgi:hypothetical protein